MKVAGSFDFIVVGVGSIGAAVCWELSRRGFSVLGIDRFSPPHDRGSHSGHTRLIRKAYFEHPDYVPLLQESYRLWRELESDSGRSIYVETGLLYGCPGGYDFLTELKTSAQLHRIPLETVAPEVLGARFSDFSFADDFEVLFESEAGYLRVIDAIDAFTEGSVRRGAEFSLGETVLGWKTLGDSVEVTTDRRVCRAGKVVLTTGPWAAELIPDARERLSVTRQVLAWFGVDGVTGFDQGDFPCWAIVDRNAQGLFYGFPVGADRHPDEPHGLKMAHHHPSTPTLPDAVSRKVTDDDLAGLIDFKNVFLPRLSDRIAGASVCLYENSPDGDFVIGNVAGSEGLACAAWGLSGHGFKFAPAVGAILADFAVDGRSEYCPAMFSASRFLD